MTKGRVLVLLSLILLLLLAVSGFVKKEQSTFVVSVFKSEGGWGYNIIKDEKIYIHQSYIPVIQQNIPFNSYLKAYKAGKMVIRKLEKKMSPALTKEEIESITGVI